MDSNWKLQINNFLSKAIIVSLYFFAFGLFISKKLTNVSSILVCLFGLLQLIIMKENPFIKIKDKTLNLPILSIAFALLMSFIGHPYTEVFLKVQTHLLFYLLFYTIVFNINIFSQVKMLLTLASISMCISSMVGIYQHFFLKIPRIEGLLTSPISFGNYLGIFIIFMIVYSLYGKISAYYRVSAFIGIVLLVANLLFTQSRGPWLGFLGGVLTFSWLKNKKILIPLVMICLLLYLFLPSVYIDRFKSIFDTLTDNSNMTRITLWKSALSMYQDHFINGVGLNRFAAEYETNYQQPYPIPTICHPHNNILKYMAETGIIGLIAFIWLMLTIIIWLYKNTRQIADPQWRLFFLASLCSIVTFNIQGLTDVNYGGNSHGDAMSFFWLLIGLNMVIVNLCKKNPRQVKDELLSNPQDLLMDFNQKIL